MSRIRKVLGHRLLLPACLVSAVGIGGLVAAVSGGSASGAPAAASSSSARTVSSSSTTSTTSPLAVTSPGGITHQNTSPISRGSRYPVGQRPRHSFSVYRNGQLVAYGDRSIVYRVPPSSYIPAGQALFAQDCSSCHGPSAQGSQFAPNLQGLGPATIDFWVTTGRMPSKDPLAVEAPEKPPQLSNKQAEEIAAYVDSLDPSTPYIPSVNTKNANLAVGAELFSLNCAACHTITGAGDALAKGTFAPSLHINHQPTATQTAEAIRTGPANMPRFNGGNLTDRQVADLVKYVTEKIEHPSNPGGFGLGGIGPVAEGFVVLLFGVGGLMLVSYWIGNRTEREGDEGETAGDQGDEHGQGAAPRPEPVSGGTT